MDQYHFIGIKGCGMSAMAQILHDLGNDVQGEDTESILFTQSLLEKRKIPAYPFGNAPLSCDMKVIASNAFGDEHPSLVNCKKMGLSVVRYHHFLGELIEDYTSIAVAGSHGKTTTTGMMAHVFGEIEPTCHLIGDGTGKGHPDARLFIFESCEYRRHFLAYQPDIAVITNIDFDHPDYFVDLDDVCDAFEQMASRTRKQLVVCGDDPQIQAMRRTCSPRVLYYGFGKHNDLRASEPNIKGNKLHFDVYFMDVRVNQFSIPIYGKHNILNALAVIGVALTLGLDLNIIRNKLAVFPGVKRRLSERECQSNILIDDYAHHPSEIRATLEAVRSKYPQKKVVGVFQPHTFSRLAKFLDDFAHSLNHADDIFLCPIFSSAREGRGNISIEDLQERIPNARLVSDNIAADLSLYKNSVFVFMGAGDIQKYQENLLEVSYR